MMCDAYVAALLAQDDTRAGIERSILDSRRDGLGVDEEAARLLAVLSGFSQNRSET